MTKRELSPAETKLWRHVAHTVKPLRLEPTHLANIQSKNQPRIHGGKGLTGRPGQALNTRADKQTRRGRLTIERKIDLHDLTRDQAFDVLVREIRRSHQRGFRCVLVVTGKGKNLEGVLRSSLRGWLESPYLRPMVAEYAQAHIRHGGSGAYYVFLKRIKSGLKP